MTELPNLLWVDLETTGLNPGEHVPLEIAVVVTDADLNEIEVYQRVINQDIVLNLLSNEVLDMHLKNNLLGESARSVFSVDDVTDELYEFMLRTDLWPDLSAKPPLCGSSINFEREWLQFWFPKFYGRIHYRSIDVSSLKELMLRWNPMEAISRRETSKHRALDDIRDSIDELRHYRDVLAWTEAPFGDGLIAR